ncbi:MAG: polysaccharide biosynthesis tyrosine autokinase [Leeuwenhoekiella sp.]
MDKNKEENVITAVIEKYISFWPLFLLSILIGLLAAWIYLQYATPLYKSTATLIIKDNSKGVDDSNITKSLNFFDSKKIVENEIEVIKSKSVIMDVVKDLKLYAPVFYNVDNGNDAYGTVPFRIEIRDLNLHAEHTNLSKPIIKRPLTYDSAKAVVLLENREYPLDTWVNTAYGSLKFSKTDSSEVKNGGKYFFMLLNPKSVAEDVLENLNVITTNKLSSVINLEYTDPIPQRGKDILNAIIDSYNEIGALDREQLSHNTLDFINMQLLSVENELDSIRNKIQQYRSQNDAFDLSEQSRLYLKNVGDTDTKIADISQQLSVLDRIENYLLTKNNRVGLVPSTLGINDEFLLQLLEKLYDKELEYNRLKNTVAANNPLLLTLSGEIANIRPSILENVRSLIDNLRASLQDLRSTTSRYNTSLKTIPEKERELVQISLRESTLNELYNFLLTKRVEVSMSYSPTGAQTRVVDRATVLPIPVKPKPLLVYAIAAVVAFSLSFGVVFSRETFGPSILFRSDLEARTSIPIIAEFSYPKKANQKVKDSVAEEFLELGIAIGLYRSKIPTQRILITSAIDKEGKSYVSRNLAMSLAKAGKKVLLIDLDFKKKSNTNYFKLNDASGLSEIDSSQSSFVDLVYSTDQENLFVVPTGQQHVNSSKLVVSGNVGDLLSQFSPEYEYIIIDTQSVEHSSDAYLLAEYCDKSIWVVRHGFTPKRLASRFDKNKKIKYLPELAVVFNGIVKRGVFNNSKNYYGFGFDR